MKFPPSTGSVLVVIQELEISKDYQLCAMKGLSEACVLYAKVSTHGVHVDLEKRIQKDSRRKQALVSMRQRWRNSSCIYKKEGYAWLADWSPRDIQTKASNRTNTLSSRMLLVEYYCTAIPGPDAIRMNMSKSIGVPTNTATTGVEVLANIESWKIYPDQP